MRILVAGNHTPFIRGGAQEHVRELRRALLEAGHSVECLLLPFSFNPANEVQRAMDWSESLNMASPNGVSIDRLVGLQFPAYGVQHPLTVGWVMHQHREVYDLFKASEATPELNTLQKKVLAFDNKHLAPLSRRGRLFANSARVSERLGIFNKLSAEPLYHPPPLAELFYSRPPQPYFFFPSRFESLKRQLLVIQAMPNLPDNFHLVLAGEGGQLEFAKAKAADLGLTDRIHFLGRITQSEKIAWMANALAVVYPPFDEDYGYVTLEAMLASKPVVTCKDSGGPLEFVVHEETGFVVEPTSSELADALATLIGNIPRSIAMGEAGYMRYEALGINWTRVVDTLISA